jgi:hypothetical protein
MTHINPERRISIGEAHARYKKILPAMARLFANVPELERYLTIKDPASPYKA